MLKVISPKIIVSLSWNLTLTAYDPLNAIMRYYGRVCTIQGKIAPTGVDVFADNSTLPTDAAMAVLVQPAVAY
jgi:hypothetical protein